MTTAHRIALAWETYLTHKRSNHHAKLRAAAFRADGDADTAARFSAMATVARKAMNAALGDWRSLTTAARKAA